MSTDNAKGRFTTLHTKRSGSLERARQCSDITIPSILPPEGSTEDTELPTPYQSLGARGVNNLASKMLLALFPSTTPFFRLRLSEAIEQALGAGKTAVENSMRVLENKALLHIENSKLRVMMHAALKHMIVTGNALVVMPLTGDVRMFRLNQFVVVRDPMGNVTEILTKETVHPDTLPDNVREACKLNDVDGKGKGDKKDCDLYTWVKLKGKNLEWHQEIDEIVVPGSTGRAPRDESPFVVMRWTAVENEDYGRGLVEEYLGDLRSLEGLSKAIIQFAAAASKIVIMVKPNARTDEDDITDAESGDVITGDEADVSVLQLEKQADFQVAKATFDEISIRLSHAFLLRNQRDAERVTAEEIREQAQELEDVLGGVYTVQSVETQLPVVKRILAQMKESGDFPKFPKQAGKDPVTPSIVTGFEALGRTHELNRMRAFYADVINTFGEQAAAWFKLDKGIQSFATSHNVDIQELIKTPDEMEKEKADAQQQQMMATAMEKGTAPLAKGAADKLGEMT